MACTSCAASGTNCDCDDCQNGKCELTVAAMRVATGGGVTAPWPGGGELQTPPGRALTPETAAQTGRAEVTSNCMFGPPNETACQRRVRMIGAMSAVYPLKATLGAAGTIGFSPYDPGATVLIANIDSERLTACLQICEIALRVQRPAGTYIVGSATAGVAVGMANTRSSWYATEDNVALQTSTASGRKFGRRLLSTDARCNCDCIWAWSPWDLPAQLEFTYPNGLVPAAGDIVDLDFQVERTYLAAAECAMPERCGQPVWAGPALAP